ncbi:hypothetical protein K504DRAFT_530264 [Pleomassaria siparia CBS 279.74]|uniref:Spindle pole body component n=1 Tax=Pleomassaria siparia CBS 279.74 TaxID=1314801 RepID=A0A6G1KK84_9PLEO|nr:hypothetical protein K504DRAFT_530264 [Pleomassaria siparia CBS 279.74]
MADYLVHDAFATDNLWKSSSFFEDPSTYENSLFAPLQFDVPSIKLNYPYAPKEPLDRELRLPDLETFEFGSLLELDSLDEPSLSTATTFVEDEDDIWKVALELGPANKDVAFFTWEAFEGPGHIEHHTPYLSESGPNAFDAALARDDGNVGSGRVVRGNVFLDSLWNLGLGRSSILFTFDPRLRTFVPAIADGRASGLSLTAAQSLTTQFVHTGNTVLYLRSFVERTFASATSIPARVALATCVSSILSTFEDHLGRHSRAIASLLQLQRLFAKPRDILIYIARVVEAVKSAKTNEHLSSILHHRVLELEEGDEQIRRLSAEILCRVAKPSLELVGEWIGTQKDLQMMPIAERDSFVVAEDNSDGQGPVEYSYNSGMMPRYISIEDGNAIFETGNSLRFLKTHHPEHPLVCLDKFGVQAPELEWKFGWQEIEEISAKANAYEDSLRAAILNFTAMSPHKMSTYERAPLIDTHTAGQATPDSEFQKYIEESARLFDEQPQPNAGGPPDNLQVLTEQLLSNSSNEAVQGATFSPPVSLSSALSFRPLLAAQAKLVNATSLRLFFRSHQLRMHLSLQRQYHLLGDGVFSSRLASALFDPERETAERIKGTMRSGVHMGLQVGSRSNWPPASSELRLALMGVLSESWYESTLYHSTTDDVGKKDAASRKESSELPGQLNFAVRTLTEPEMEKVMDPNSLYALDFLRLQYVPPSPIHLIITSSSLEKYDLIFKFLLRLLRMLFVISHLPRTYADVESRLFRTEAHHFVTALSTYMFQTGIAEHWDNLSSFIDNVESRIADEDAAGELGTRITQGVASLRDAHEACLDSILFSLLLRRRQKKVMLLLEEIFECVLLFAKAQNLSEEMDMKELYDRLRGKVRVFIGVTRGLSGKRGYGKGRGSVEENSLERLGIALEMNGYFSM